MQPERERITSENVYVKISRKREVANMRYRGWDLGETKEGRNPKKMEVILMAGVGRGSHAREKGHRRKSDTVGLGLGRV